LILAAPRGEGAALFSRSDNLLAAILIRVSMALDPKKLNKPFTQLRKTLKKFPRKPTPDDVHDVRTRTRKVEATLKAVHMNRKRKGQRILDAVTPVRKRAGKVRDMDVLIAFASGLKSDRDHDCLVQLLEHLGNERYRNARKLHKTAAAHLAEASHYLRRCSQTMQRKINRDGDLNPWPADAASGALQLSSQLQRWPKLNRQNLHLFRLKVKELRYFLQLSGQENELVKALGEVKDAVGEWHDWVELETIANDLLQDHPSCDVRKQIHTGAQHRFGKALALANHLRKKYFANPTKDRSSRAKPKAKIHVMRATSDLAA
jgi:CHAD domain-containing protein